MQRNLERCRVCMPARSFGVDKVCLSQYLDSLFAYFLLGPSEMLVSGHSIFQCSSWGQSKNSMCWCSCRWACNLLNSFQLSSWGWVWMVLGILMLFSIFYYTAGESKTISIFSGAVHFVSRFRWIRSRNRVVVVLYIGSLMWPIAGAAGRWFLCWFGTSGLSAWSGWICCPDAEYRWAFLRLGSSCGGCKLTRLWMREWMCVVWSVSPVRDAVCVFRAGRLDFLFVVWDPANLGQSQ